MLTLTLSLALFLPTAEPDFDIVIRNATLFDGTAQPGVVGDIAITKDRIVAVGKFAMKGTPRIIDGTGLYLAPGFIDLHTHCDTGSPGITDKLGRPNSCYTFQGVTTVVTGNCGSGPVDVAEFYKKIENGGTGTNVAHQCPHNSIRSQVMGNSNRPPTDDELRKMEALVEKGMQDGGWGLATGLIYNPGTYSKTEEIIALAKMSAKYDGIYASHIRDEGIGLLTAVDETLRIGREAKLPVHISHFKSSGRKAWGKCVDAIAIIEDARSKGQIVTADQYPYIASSTSLSATLVPSRFREGDNKSYRARYDDPEIGKQLRTAISDALEGRKKGDGIMIARYSPKKEWQGKSIATIAEEAGKDPVDIVVEIEKNGGAQVVNFGMREEDIRVIMKQNFVTTASDGSTQIGGDTVPHPRSYGTFPRKIGFYAIEEKQVTVEHAIRSASGLPADILRLPERGYLKVGYYADIVVFDPKTFRDVATFAKPHQLSTGVKFLFVNGKLVIEDGKETGTLPGLPLRHKAR